MAEEKKHVIDWTKPIEYRTVIDDIWAPARLLGTRKNTDGFSHVVMFDVGTYEAVANVSANSSSVRNVPEKLNGYCITVLKNNALSSFTGPGAATGISVGHRYCGGRVVAVVEFEFTKDG